MTMGNRIAQKRKERGMTQESLAKQLDVTNQAVSKWESDQCCPDITLLPRLAEIFGITIDELFGREAPHSGVMEMDFGDTVKVTQDPNFRIDPKAPELPWEDDGVLRAVLFVGRELVLGHPAAERIEFCYEGPALNITSEFSVTCGDVGGSVSAGLDVTCDEVCGSVNAGGSVTCDEVNGPVNAGGNVTCDDIHGDVRAGGDVTCDEIEGSATAGNSIHF